MFISDFMELTIRIPNDVNIDVNTFKVLVSGEKGKLERNFYSPIFKNLLKIEKINDSVKVSINSDKRKMKSEVGTVASHIRNMIEGVTKGYTYKLKIIYMHFPITVKVSGKEIVVNNFLGEEFPRKAKTVGDCKVEVQGEEIIVTGINKEEVGQTVANIERATRIKARDRRVFMDGIYKTSEE